MKKLSILFAALTMCAMSYAADYVKVTSAPTDWSGEYLLVYEEAVNTAYVWTGADSASCYTTATIAEGKISGDDFITITIAPMTGGYSIMVNGGINNGKYISGASSSNKLFFDATASLDTITFDNEGVKIVSNTSVMRFNKAADNLRFRFFKSASYSRQQAVQLYKKGGSAIAATAITLNKETASIEQYKRDTLEATLEPAGATTPIVWSSSDEDIATVANGIVTAKAVGTATITATAGTLTATCVVTVTDTKPITVAKALEIAKTVTKNNEIAAGGQYVIHGYAVEVDTTKYSTYKNYSVWLNDEKGGEKVFEAYRVIPADGKTIVAVGDYVEVIGDITMYYNSNSKTTTYETAKGGSIKVLQDPTTAVENTTTKAVKAKKVIENGQLIIIDANGVRYNAVGVVIE